MGRLSLPQSPHLAQRPPVVQGNGAGDFYLLWREGLGQSPTKQINVPSKRIFFFYFYRGKAYATSNSILSTSKHIALWH